MDTFPECKLSVGEVEQCMRRQRVDACLQGPESQTCREHRECFWGIVHAPAAEGSCDPWHRRWELALTPRSKAARARLLKRLQEANESPRCRGSAIYVSVTGEELQLMFGRHLTLRAVPGAGNNTRSCGWFAEQSPASFVPAKFAPDVLSAQIATDAKLDLLDDWRPCFRAGH
jgi:hypothetical protein